MSKAKSSRKSAGYYGQLLVRRTHPDAKLPTKLHPSDVGYDLYAAEGGWISNEGVTKVRLGICLGLPPEIFGLIYERSSSAKEGLFVLGQVVDPGYTGEIHLWIGNLGVFSHEYMRGERLAQLILLPAGPTDIKVKEVDDLRPTDRGEKSLGSSGK